MCEKMKDKVAVVEVSCLVDFDELDGDDRAEDGTCLVFGSYHMMVEGVPVNAPPEVVTERALDHFHNKFAIACLDDFQILARLANANDELTAMQDIVSIRFERAAGSAADVSSDLPEPSPYGTSDPFDPFPTIEIRQLAVAHQALRGIEAGWEPLGSR